jgi:hypothetical protein
MQHSRHELAVPARAGHIQQLLTPCVDAKQTRNGSTVYHGLEAYGSCLVATRRDYCSGSDKRSAALSSGNSHGGRSREG